MRDDANPNTCEGYELMADVDLSGTDWAPIGIFEKVFDGNGHTIDNLTIDTDGLLNVGLFSELFVPPQSGTWVSLA